jgi:hypothetical protein
VHASLPTELQHRQLLVELLDLHLLDLVGQGCVQWRFRNRGLRSRYQCSFCSLCNAL